MKGTVHVLFAVVLVALVARSSSQEEHHASGYIERFTCSDGFIIDESWRCDGSDDCPDGSDEIGCRLSCDIHQFRCHDNSQCVPHWRVCNGRRDCADGSDESQCTTPPPTTVPTCAENQVLCGNNQSCVWAAFHCDGSQDCGDGSDELNCDRNPGCTENQFQCDSGLCIPMLYVCDGQNDCPSRHVTRDVFTEDEFNCDSTMSCGASLFKCNNGRCINIHDVCDGNDHCGDNSDEVDDCPAHLCPRSKFGCLVRGKPTCIQTSWVCDGQKDCDNAEDEYECEGTCLDSFFQCSSTTQCVTQEKRCDGRPDCDDHSDEYVCPFSPSPGYCDNHQVLCLDGLLCLEASDICDGIPNCVDGSDENEFCQRNDSFCKDDNGGCEHNCHTLPYNRTVCSCLPGYQLNSTDLASCHDYDECSHPNSCEQLCANSPGNYSCSCSSGYQQSAGGSCRATGPKAYLMFANRVDIRRIGIDGRAPHLLVKHLKYAADVDYHHRMGYMFWVDLHRDNIMRADLVDGLNITVIINSSLVGPSGLAVDWVNNKLYWTDGDTGLIEVAELDGRHRKRLFSVNLDKPRAIAVDPQARLMFWTDWGSNPKIERASLDGNGRKVIHSDHIIWPNALTLDLPTKTIYWADAKLHIIEASDYYGLNRRPIITSGILHPFAMTVFENKLYWSDWSGLSIQSASRLHGHGVTLLNNSTVLDEQLSQNSSTVHKGLYYPMGVRVVHPVLQPPRVGEDPCQRAARAGNGCQFLCLLSSEREEGYSCACPTGTELGENGTECNVIQNFLLYSRRGGIHLVTVDDIETTDIPLPVSDTSGPTGLDIDPVNKILYWTDLFKHTISSLTLDGFRQNTVIDTELQAPAGIAVDWINRKLYWSNSYFTRSGIEVSELDGRNRMVLVTRGVGRPRDVVVHPKAGLLFWTDTDNSYPNIGRSNLDGSERVIIADSGITLPNGLAVDYELDRLYWCDATTDMIEYVHLDGSNRTTLVELVIHPFGLTIYNNRLYWTDWVQGAVNVVNKVTGANRRLLVENIEGIIDLHAHAGSDVLEKVPHPCAVSNGGCSDLCLSRPSQSVPVQLEASCVCPGGRTVTEDGRTCLTDVREYLVYSTNTQLIQISLDNSILNPTPLPVRNLAAPSATDVDFVENTIYWTNKLEGKIYKSPISGGTRSVAVSIDLINPEVLAVDSIGQKLYWSDTGTGLIEVSALDGSNRKVIISENIHQVNSMTLDIQERSLYWIDAGNDTVMPKIEKSAMDGSGRTVVISEMSGMPRSIVVHHTSQGTGGRIYWTDEMMGVIESAALDGSDQRVMAVLNSSTSAASPYGIAVSDDFLYWTDIVDDAVYKMSMDSFSHRTKRDTPTEKFAITTGSNAVGPLTLVKIDSARFNHTLQNHPCRPGRHPCSHLCLPNWSSSGYSCHCPTGLQKKTPSECWNVPRQFMVGAVERSLVKTLQSSPDSGKSQTINATVWGPVAVDHLLHSIDSGKIFFSDRFRGTISSINLNGTNQVDLLRVGVVAGLAINWVDKYIYWTDATHKRIEVARMDGSGRKILYQYPQSVLEAVNPRGLALHPKKGVMYWTDWGTPPAIMRARMDGSIVSAIVETGIRWPNSVAIDYDTDLVYWIDASYHHIERADLNGHERKVILTYGSEPRIPILYHGFHLLVKDHHVYWSEWVTNTVYRARLPTDESVSKTPEDLISIDDATVRYFGFTVVNTSAPRLGELSGSNVMSACGFNNGGCFGSSYLCLPINQVQRLCACPDELQDCVEYYGYTGGPPPPSVVAMATTTPGPDLHRPKSVQAATSVVTMATTESDEGERRTEKLSAIVQTDHVVSSEDTPQYVLIYSSISERLIIVITLIVMIFIVMVSLTIIFITTVVCIRKQKKKIVYTATNTQRKQFSNPIYVPMTRDTIRREPSHSSSSSSIPPTPSREEGFSLLPKLNNAKVIPTSDLTPSQDRARKTNSNIFVEEPDVFIMPGKSNAAPRRERTPEIIPFKPLLPLPPGDDVPLKTLPPPPPVPPKTYVTLKFDEKVDLAPKKTNNAPPILETKPSVLSGGPLEAKQSNVDCAKTVKFHSDVKFPADPPPLPAREGYESRKKCIAKESNKTRPLSGALPEDCEANPSQLSPQCSCDVTDRGIAIVTKDGTRIGEVVSGSASHSDYDRLLPIKPVGPSSDYDRLLPTATIAPSDKLSDNMQEESQC